MPRKRAPEYECSFCGEELAGAWLFPLHRCEPIAQLEVIIGRVLANAPRQHQPAAAAGPSAEDTARAAIKRAAEFIGAQAGINLDWNSIASFPEEFARALRAARSATHPDRQNGSEEVFKLVNQAADILKAAFQQKGIKL